MFGKFRKVCLFMSILNIHGYKGTPHNAAYSALCGFAKENIITPYIDYDNEKSEDILNRLLDICSSENIELIVGTSLGGFFAVLIGIKLKKSLILVNPCLQPHKVIPLYGYQGDVNWFIDKLSVFDNIDRKSISCIIGGKDEIIGDHAYTKKLIGNDRIIVVPEGMHSGATLELEKNFSQLYSMGNIIRASLKTCRRSDVPQI